MTKEELKNKLSFLLGKKSDKDSSVMRINNLLDLVNALSEDDIHKISAIEKFIAMCGEPSSSLDNFDGSLDVVLEEVRQYIRRKQQQVKSEALTTMHATKRSHAIIGIVVLAIIASVSMTLGILSIYDKVPSECCDIIGVLDFVFGMAFFGYELYDDKVRENKICSGDVEEISKHVAVTNTVNVNAAGGAQVNTGIVLGNMVNGVSNKDYLSNLFKHLL